MSVSLERYRIHLTGLQLAELPDIAEQPTVTEMPALPKSAQLDPQLAVNAWASMPALPKHVKEWTDAQLEAKVTRPQLPLDELGRPYLKVINPFEDTQDLVQAAVTRFIELEGTRPQVILLSAWHYFTWGMIEQFYPLQPKGMDAVPFGFEYGKELDYDILVVGEKSV